MLVTIWMWTHEWSLISMRTTALTLAACHHAFSCLSSLTRSINVRRLRLPRTGTLIRICCTASAGVRRVSRRASSETGCSIRCSVSLSSAMVEGYAVLEGRRRGLDRDGGCRGGEAEVRGRQRRGDERNRQAVRDERAEP